MPHNVLDPNATDRRWLPAPTARTAALVVLIALTSLAVGATTSPWLVPPYLVAMGWLLLAPAAKPIDAVVTTLPEVAPTLPEPPSEAIEAATEVAASALPDDREKPKKKRSRAKAKSKTIEAVEPRVATWVQIAPGKFVRVETPVEPVPVIEPTADIASSSDELIPNQSQNEGIDQELEAVSIQAEGPETELGELPEPQPDVVVSAEEDRVDDATPSPALSQASASAELAQEVIAETFEPTPEAPTEILESVWEPIEDAPPVEEPIDEPLIETEDVPAVESEKTAHPEGPPAQSLRSGLNVRRDPPDSSRLWRMRKDPRPKLRRATGRVGASPRVTLNRS